MLVDGSIEKRTLEYASSNLVENRPNILKPFGGHIFSESFVFITLLVFNRL
jgi:Cft2 family RNA processing exonuclease